MNEHTMSIGKALAKLELEIATDLQELCDSMQEQHGVIVLSIHYRHETAIGVRDRVIITRVVLGQAP